MRRSLVGWSAWLGRLLAVAPSPGFAAQPPAPVYTYAAFTFAITLVEVAATNMASDPDVYYVVFRAEAAAAATVSASSFACSAARAPAFS